MKNLFNESISRLQEWLKIFQDLGIMTAIHFVCYFLICLFITLVLTWFVGKLTEKRISPHHSMLFRRLTFYIGLILSLILPLTIMGINISPFLAAGGILTAAVAFAAQTSMSNFLSGVFLVAEQPFVIGDFVNVNDMLGEVLSIDMLSVKIRTKDNIMVRIPNSTLLSSQFKNVSRFPIRRFDIKFKVYFQEDLNRLKNILLEVASKNTLCLVSPPPDFSFVEFGDIGILVQFSVWGKQSTYSALQTNIQMEIQAALKENKIDLPVHTGVGG